MTDSDIIQAVLTSGLEGAGILLLLVIAYKIKKMRISTESKCCDDHIKVNTNNTGDSDLEQQ